MAWSSFVNGRISSPSPARRSSPATRSASILHKKLASSLQVLTTEPKAHDGRRPSPACRSSLDTTSASILHLANRWWVA